MLTGEGNRHSKVSDVFELPESKDVLQLLDRLRVVGGYERVHLVDYAIDARDAVLGAQLLYRIVPDVPELVYGPLRYKGSGIPFWICKLGFGNAAAGNAAVDDIFAVSLQGESRLRSCKTSAVHDPGRSGSRDIALNTPET